RQGHRARGSIERFRLVLGPYACVHRIGPGLVHARRAWAVVLPWRIRYARAGLLVGVGRAHEAGRARSVLLEKLARRTLAGKVVSGGPKREVTDALRIRSVQAVQEHPDENDLALTGTAAVLRPAVGGSLALGLSDL